MPLIKLRLPGSTSDLCLTPKALPRSAGGLLGMLDAQIVWMP